MKTIGSYVVLLLTTLGIALLLFSRASSDEYVNSISAARAYIPIVHAPSPSHYVKLMALVPGGRGEIRCVETLADDHLLVIGRADHESPYVSLLSATGEPEWHRVLVDTNTNSDLRFGDVRCNPVLVDDHLYLVSSVYEFETNNSDAVLLKMTLQGDLVWAKRIGDPERLDHAFGLAPGPDGNIVIAGNKTVPTNAYATFLAEVTPQGAIVQVTEYPLLQNLLTIRTDEHGRFVLAGTHCGFGPDPWRNGCLAKLDSDGTLLWQRAIGSYDTGTELKSIEVASNGDFVLTGSYHEHSWVLRVDTDGNIIWHKSFDDTVQIRGASVTQDGGIALVGKVEEVLSNGDYSDALFVGRLDPGGRVMWERAYGSEGPWTTAENEDDGFAVVELSTGDLLVGGYSSSFDADFIDAILLRLDGQGRVPDCPIAGDRAYGLIADPDPLVVAAQPQQHTIAMAVQDISDLQLVEIEPGVTYVCPQPDGRTCKDR